MCIIRVYVYLDKVDMIYNFFKPVISYCMVQYNNPTLLPMSPVMWPRHDLVLYAHTVQ